MSKTPIKLPSILALFCRKCAPHPGCRLQPLQWTLRVQCRILQWFKGLVKSQKSRMINFHAVKNRGTLYRYVFNFLSLSATSQESILPVHRVMMKEYFQYFCVKIGPEVKQHVSLPTKWQQNIMQIKRWISNLSEVYIWSNRIHKFCTQWWRLDIVTNERLVVLEQNSTI